MVWLEVVGWVGSALLVWSLLQTRILRLRLLNLVGSAVLIVYNALAEVWPMLGLNVVLALINIWQLRTLITTRHDEASYVALEVEPESPLVRHVLQRHRQDIRRFNPELALEPATDRIALAVLSGDEVAGVVLFREGGDGVARIELDYVTPRFRDFTPGEFVFRQSGFFTARGFTKIVTPSGMVSPYYDRLGFGREDTSYVLHLTPAGPAGTAGAGPRPTGPT